MDGVEVRRFRYAPSAWERLAYQGGLLANLRRWPWLHALLPIFLLAQFLAIRRALRDLNCDAVQAHWIVPQGLVLAAALGFSASRPHWICTVHGSDVSALRGPLWSRVRRSIMGRCSHVVAVGEDLRRALIAEGAPPGKVSVIPMGSDLQGLFVPDGSERAIAELLFVGRLVASKGLDILLRALPEIRAVHPAVRLTVVGDGPERARFETVVSQSEFASAVAFVGAVDHAALAGHFQRATLLVVPSRAEGFGLVAVEALGCACPVVASDLPALRNILADGRGGRLFRSGDPDDLRDQVCALLADVELRCTLTKTGRASVLARFDWRAIGQRYLAVLSP